jgi:hypothetical protein
MLFVLKKQFNVYKMFALYDTAVNDRLFATYSFVRMEIEVQNKRRNWSNVKYGYFKPFIILIYFKNTISLCIYISWYKITHIVIYDFVHIAQP